MMRGRGRLLDRYERTDDGGVVIDVSAARMEDLYEDFDKSAPHIRRDLDQDLVDYLIECARELGRVNFVIRFTLGHPLDETGFSRIARSVNGYFLYLTERAREKVLQMFRRSAILFFIGLALLFVSVSVNRLLGEERSVVANVFAEGLTVAAWVSLWEALALFLIDWFPLRRDVGLYRRLSKVRLLLRHDGSGR
jgi:hypothetical protein